MAKQLGFYFNASACTACKACQVACQDKNNLSAAMRWRRVVSYGGGSWVPDPQNAGLMLPNNVFVYSISSACYHCVNPLCAEVCPAAAISKKDNGLVLINQEQCIGCRYCEWACPYGAPAYDQARAVMTKCTGCDDLVAQGKNPVCVDACVMRAIEFGDIEQLRAKYGHVDSIEPLPEAKYTGPAVVITPHKHSQASGKGTGKILNLPEEV
ncbi:MAG: dimethylsulfoxide reductase subunit B [Chloroflexi bacterium]|nr:dimethylsulfoxide reductase subunit B [Chloroflexota bacterium]